MENIESYQVNDSNFILYKKEGVIMNGGFSLASLLKTQKGGSKQMDESLKQYSVIPSGLFYTENKRSSSVNHSKRKEAEEEAEPHKEIPDELYEKLLGLASVDGKEKQKRKKDKTKRLKPIKSNKKTFKNNAS
jgi:hypothetical protein